MAEAPEYLTDKQRATVDYLTSRQLGLRASRAYAWRLSFDAFFDQPPSQAKAYLERWYRGAIRSSLEPIKSFAYTVADHWMVIPRWHTTKRSSGILGSINSLVQASRRRTRGYCTTRNLIAGKLAMGLPT